MSAASSHDAKTEYPAVTCLPGTDGEQRPLGDITVTRKSVEMAEILTVAGEIDIATYRRLREALIQAVDDGPGTVIVDMAGVEWIDSTGLGTLVGALKRARGKGGTVQVAAVPDRIARHFKVTGLSKLFGMHPNAEAALVRDQGNGPGVAAPRRAGDHGGAS